MAGKMTIDDTMKIIAEKFDARDNYRALLKKYFAKNGHVPKRFRLDWERLKNEKPWREDRKVLAVLKRAARNFARNENAKATIFSMFPPTTPPPMPPAPPPQFPNGRKLHG
jgi:dTDP-D-glucose 4,6-dehydratase